MGDSSSIQQQQALAHDKQQQQEQNQDNPPTKDRKAAAIARKRRIELRSLQRAATAAEANSASVSSRSTCSRTKAPSLNVAFCNSSDEDLTDSESCAAESRKRARLIKEEALLVDPVTSKPKPSIMGIKRQSRYDPGVPMTRAELKVWRKEARRVRNRESAAASRKRNRERITELEGEVQVLNTKYTAALQRIIELEASLTVADAFTPVILREDLCAITATAQMTLPPETTATIAATAPPTTMSLSEDGPTTGVPNPLAATSSSSSSTSSQASSSSSRPVKLKAEKLHAEEVDKKYQHIMNMILRPSAVKLLRAGTPTVRLTPHHVIPSSPLTRNSSENSSVATAATVPASTATAAYLNAINVVPSATSEENLCLPPPPPAHAAATPAAAAPAPATMAVAATNAVTRSHPELDESDLEKFLMDTFDEMEEGVISHVAV